MDAEGGGRSLQEETANSFGWEVDIIEEKGVMLSGGGWESSDNARVACTGRAEKGGRAGRRWA